MFANIISKLIGTLDFTKDMCFGVQRKAKYIIHCCFTVSINTIRVTKILETIKKNKKKLGIKDTDIDKFSKIVAEMKKQSAHYSKTIMSKINSLDDLSYDCIYKLNKSSHNVNLAATKQSNRLCVLHPSLFGLISKIDANILVKHDKFSKVLAQDRTIILKKIINDIKQIKSDITNSAIPSITDDPDELQKVADIDDEIIQDDFITSQKSGSSDDEEIENPAAVMRLVKQIDLDVQKLKEEKLDLEASLSKKQRIVDIDDEIVKDDLILNQENSSHDERIENPAAVMRLVKQIHLDVQKLKEEKLDLEANISKKQRIVDVDDEIVKDDLILNQENSSNDERVENPAALTRLVKQIGLDVKKLKEASLTERLKLEKIQLEKTQKTLRENLLAVVNTLYNLLIQYDTAEDYIDIDRFNDLQDDLLSITKYNEKYHSLINNQLTNGNLTVMPNLSRNTGIIIDCIERIKKELTKNYKNDSNCRNFDKLIGVLKKMQTSKEIINNYKKMIGDHDKNLNNHVKSLDKSSMLQDEFINYTKTIISSIFKNKNKNIKVGGIGVITKNRLKYLDCMVNNAKFKYYSISSGNRIRNFFCNIILGYRNIFRYARRTSAHSSLIKSLSLQEKSNEDLNKGSNKNNNGISNNKIFLDHYINSLVTAETESAWFAIKNQDPSSSSGKKNN